MTTTILQLIGRQIGISAAIETNADYRASLLFTQVGSTSALDLTGIAFHSQIRPAVGSAEILLDLSTDNGLLINGGTSGMLSWLVPESVTKLLPPGAAVADLLAIADGVILNLCQGAPMTVTIAQGVTCSL